MLSGYHLILIFFILIIISVIYFIKPICRLLVCSIGGVKTRMLVESVTLGQEWQTFTFRPPLEVQRVGQVILMQLEGVTDWVEPHGALLLNDGSKIQIEVKLIDQNGERHALVPVSIGASVGFGPARAEEGAGFAKGRQFIELRLRSNKPILTKKIEWYCWTGK